MAKRGRPPGPAKSVRKKTVAAVKKAAKKKAKRVAPKVEEPIIDISNMTDEQLLKLCQPELITIQQAADLGSLSITTIKRMVRKRKRGEPRCPFGFTHIGRAVRIHRNEFLAAIHNGIPHV